MKVRDPSHIWEKRNVGGVTIESKHIAVSSVLREGVNDAELLQLPLPPVAKLLTHLISLINNGQLKMVNSLKLDVLCFNLRYLQIREPSTSP